jgi:hypothetical protein
MLRMQIAAVLFLGAAMAQADGEIDKYLGKYTANQVCDSHATTTDVEPHVRRDGEFIIAKFINADGEERAIAHAVLLLPGPETLRRDCGA